MPLLDPKPTYKPFAYPWAYEAWQLQQRLHWLPDEVPLADDVKDWQRALTEGERNLLTVSDFSGDMGSLRKLFDLFEQKAQLMRLLDVSSRAEGVRIYIGGESQVIPYQELSVVTAPYEVDGQVVGTLGVIGPMRMPYEKMIQIVDITYRLVSTALSHSK